MTQNATKAHVLGFPRIGADREMKKAVESYWQSKTDQTTLLAAGKAIRAFMWDKQKNAGLDYVTVGDFAWYDHMLNHSALFGAIPERFVHPAGEMVDLDTIFRVARGRAPQGKPAYASEMTKWFDTNYHYIVPELTSTQTFSLSYTALFDEIDEALALGHTVKPVLVGPVSYLYLSKCAGSAFDRTTLLNRLLPVYEQVLALIAEKGVEWVQIDEPIATLDLSEQWRNALTQAYKTLAQAPVKLLLATYFGTLQDNKSIITDLPVAGIHLDAVRAAEEVDAIVSACNKQQVISVGMVNGRNIWCNNLRASVKQLQTVQEKMQEHQTLWVASSCSLLHSPVDVSCETALDADIRSWLAFAVQKCSEVATLASVLAGVDCETQLATSDAIVQARASSTKVHNDAVQKRCTSVTQAMAERTSPYSTRIEQQRALLQLPAFPTTSIGSFPQTDEIRAVRRDFKSGKIEQAAYEAAMEKEIAFSIRKQEDIGLDVLVHGEPERNDMVEYFGELMQGYAFTLNGWVQSYGSRCVKPPIIYGDVSRPEQMTVRWAQYAQSLSEKPVKGMLTGPITMLFWSFVRDDIAREQVCYQIALALRDEVLDLEAANIHVIQVDEPAFREGLPLRKAQWQEYLDWAVKSFRLSVSGARDNTQIHTHMCYSEFNDIIESIAALDADVITIETSRSNMELLDAFETFNYPNDIGPGVYDIHSPNIPDTDAMTALMEKATERVSIDKLWVNPDCGLKTRKWQEVEPALINMVKSAEQLRAKFVR